MPRARAKPLTTKLLIAVVVGVAAYNAFQGNIAGNPPSNATEQAATQAFNNQQSDVQVRGMGVVKAVLRDDNEGSRHQKMLLSLPSGQTLLIAHNIDLAPRISDLRKGDIVEFYGEYEWTAKGGVVHWTHRDPRGRHEHGWLKHGGTTYE